MHIMIELSRHACMYMLVIQQRCGVRFKLFLQKCSVLGIYVGKSRKWKVDK